MTIIALVIGALLGGVMMSILGANQYGKGYEDGKLEK